MIVSVVAGGWSVSGVSLSDIPGTIIAVNDAALHLPRVDLIVSMDRMWTEGRWHWLEHRKIETYIRRSAVQNIRGYHYPRDWLHVFDCDETSVQFGKNPGRLDGTNSGTCALALSYQMHPRVLALFGFDMQHGPKGERHWYPQYPWAGQSPAPKSLNNWAREFKQIRKQFDDIGTKVLNVSNRSLIRDFKVVSMDKLMELTS